MPKVVKHLHMYFYALITLCPINNMQRHSIRMMEQMEPGNGAYVILGKVNRPTMFFYLAVATIMSGANFFA